MIYRTAESEQDIQRALDVYLAADPPATPGWEARVLAHWQRLYAACPQAFWLAEDEASGQIEGVASAMLMPPQWILSNFYVCPDCQGKGIGKALMERVCATSEGCERFLVHASEHPSAVNTYMKRGMFPLPPSLFFPGFPDAPEPPVDLEVEPHPLGEILDTLDAFDRQALGFSRVDFHKWWGETGRYYLIKKYEHILGYFRVSTLEDIGPLVVSDERWMASALDWAIIQQRAISPDPHVFFVPGANRSAITHLLKRGYRFIGTNLLMSSHPMPGLARVIFHDTDLL